VVSPARLRPLVGGIRRLFGRTGEPQIGAGGRDRRLPSPQNEPISRSADGLPATRNNPHRNAHGTPEDGLGIVQRGRLVLDGSSGRVEAMCPKIESLLEPGSHSNCWGSNPRLVPNGVQNCAPCSVSDLCLFPQKLDDPKSETSCHFSQVEAETESSNRTFVIRMITTGNEQQNPNPFTAWHPDDDEPVPDFHSRVPSGPRSRRSHTARTYPPNSTPVENTSKTDNEWDQIFEYDSDETGKSVCTEPPLRENIRSGRTMLGDGVYWNAGPPVTTQTRPKFDDRNDPINCLLELAGQFEAPNQSWCCHSCGGWWWRKGCGYDVARKRQSKNAPLKVPLTESK
jgi:hypothetical protein